MKKNSILIIAILGFQISFAQFTKDKRDKKDNPCPYPADALHQAKTQKEQQAIMRAYLECKQSAKEEAGKKEEADKQRQREANPNRVGDNPSTGNSNSGNASNGNGGRQRQDANKERDHQRYE